MLIRAIGILAVALFLSNGAWAQGGIESDVLSPVEGRVELIDPVEKIIQIDQLTYAISGDVKGLDQAAEGQRVRVSLLRRQDGIYVTEVVRLER